MRDDVITADYEKMTPAEKAAACNGCGGKGGFLRPIHWFNITECCNCHDFLYDPLSGDLRTRLQSDLFLMRCILSKGKGLSAWSPRRWYYEVQSRVYFLAVRAVGWVFWKKPEPGFPTTEQTIPMPTTAAPKPPALRHVRGWPYVVPEFSDPPMPPKGTTGRSPVEPIVVEVKLAPSILIPDVVPELDESKASARLSARIVVPSSQAIVDARTKGTLADLLKRKQP